MLDYGTGTIHVWLPKKIFKLTEGTFCNGRYPFYNTCNIFQIFWEITEEEPASHADKFITILKKSAGCALANCPVYTFVMWNLNLGLIALKV